jgi:predicted Zn-dependent peptidase
MTATQAVAELKKKHNRTVSVQSFYSVRHTWRRKKLGQVALAQIKKSQEEESIDDIRAERDALKKKNQLLRDILMRCIMEE